MDAGHLEAWVLSPSGPGAFVCSLMQCQVWDKTCLHHRLIRREKSCANEHREVQEEAEAGSHGHSGPGLGLLLRLRGAGG